MAIAVVFAVRVVVPPGIGDSVGEGKTIVRGAEFCLHRCVARAEQGHGGSCRIGEGATVSHGAVVDERTRVGPHNVIMKQEHLLPALDYQGVPTPTIMATTNAAAVPMPKGRSWPEIVWCIGYL